MKGYFCVHCGKEVPITIKKDRTWFYCECMGTYNHVAYFREIEDKSKTESEIEIHDVLDVSCYSAEEKVKEYLRNNVFVSAVAAQTCLDFDVIKKVMFDLFEYNGE